MRYTKSKNFLLITCMMLFAVCTVYSSACSRPPVEKEKKKKPAAGKGIKAPAVDKDKMQRLEALGYFDRAPAENPEEKNVVKDKSTAFEGLNLYSPRRRAKAHLVDMNGRVLHTWSSDALGSSWMHTELQPDGSIIVIAKSSYIAKIDFNSNVLWKQKSGAHHDLAIGPDGNIHTLVHSIRRYIYQGSWIRLLDDAISTYSPDGKFLRKKQLYPVLRKLIPVSRLRQIKRRCAGEVSSKDIYTENSIFDVFHTNSLQFLKNDIKGIAPARSLLLSVREINRIVILSADLSKLLWEWGEGELEEQHHATLQDNGNIMVFDNGIIRKQSRVIEVSPHTGKIEWSYTEPGFYTELRGAAQKLTNDNVLITESDRGHAFEVTRKGETLWEWWNPDVTGGEKPTRAVIYRMRRYPPDYLEKGLIETGAVSE